jgi:glycosyltransferase involved in cell wall biosynthesis
MLPVPTGGHRTGRLGGLSPKKSVKLNYHLDHPHRLGKREGSRTLHDTESPPRISVIIPCLNEEMTVGKVVRDFSDELPEATIYVFDNNSTDRTAEVARKAGAEVVHSPHRGKGNVIRHMSNVVEADIYVMVDGDDTYPASAAPGLIEQFRRDHLDMLVATRLTEHDRGSFRIFHRAGNHIVSRVVSMLFSAEVTDVLSGYRVLSRDLLKLVRLQATGFEVETELTLQALAKRLNVAETPVEYGVRPEGSHSKLSTWGDGFMILKSLFLIFKDYKPLFFFSVISGLLVLASLASGIGPVTEFYQTGMVFQLPRVVLAAGLGILATISMGVGLILGTISKYHEENIALWKQQIKEIDRLASGNMRPGADD